MKVGDLVKTRVPGFGTGATEKQGIVIEAAGFISVHGHSVIEVLHSDGTTLNWYSWQLENLNE